MTANCIQLDHFDLLRLSGQDSASFLQGQLTCNVDKVTPQRSAAGACCNLKGRVVADFRLFQLEDDYFLLTGPGMGELLRQRLAKYIVFSKAEIELVTDAWRRYGLLGPGAGEVIKQLAGSDFPSGSVTEEAGLAWACSFRTESGPAIALARGGEPERVEVLLPAAASDAARRLEELAGGDQGAGGQAGEGRALQEWLEADMAQGIVAVEPETTEVFTPQLLNYDIRGLVDFHKGCYTGQEVVARMHYRAEAKKRLFRLGLSAEAAQQAGLAGALPPVTGKDRAVTPEKNARLCTATDESSQGEILRTLRTTSGLELLAVLAVRKVEAGESFCLCLNGGREPLRMLPLPGLPVTAAGPREKSTDREGE